MGRGGLCSLGNTLISIPASVRHVTWNGGYFGCIFQVRALLPKAQVRLTFLPRFRPRILIQTTFACRPSQESSRTTSSQARSVASSGLLSTRLVRRCCSRQIYNSDISFVQQSTSSSLACRTLSRCAAFPSSLGVRLGAHYRSNQQQVAGAAPKYNWTFPALLTIAREEGVGALYSGFLPKVLRLAPGGGVLLLVVEFTLGIFRKQLGPPYV